MKRSDFWFDLPEKQIAQTPVEPRDHSRLLLMNRTSGACSHHHFYDIVDQGLPLHEQSGYTDIFIYPGYQFKVLDGLITNFHLPESTLIMLVSAFAGYEHTMAAYELAVKENYRFFSFGDAMAIL